MDLVSWLALGAVILVIAWRGTATSRGAARFLAACALAALVASALARIFAPEGDFAPAAARAALVLFLSALMLTAVAPPWAGVEAWTRSRIKPYIIPFARSFRVVASGIWSRQVGVNVVALALFAIVALVWLGPVWDGGYLLLFDDTAGPRPAFDSYLEGFPPGAGAGAPFFVLEIAAATLLGAARAQVFLHYLVPLVVGSYGAFLLVPSRRFLPRFIGGLIFAYNPFVTVRLAAGQFGVVLGLALLPFVLLASRALTERPGWRTAALLAVSLTVTGFVGPHALLLAGALLLVHLSVSLLMNREKAAPVAKGVVVAVLVYAALNLYWLVLLRSSVYEAAGFLRASDLDYFALHGSEVGPLTAALALRGFWQTDFVAGPPFVFAGFVQLVVWLAFASLGIVLGWRVRANRPLIVALSALAIAGVLLAIPARGAWLSSLLSQRFPFTIYRDVQKLLMPLVLAYAVLAGLALDRLLASLENGRGTRVVALALAVVVLVPSGMQFSGEGGALGQLRTTHYPDVFDEVGPVLLASDGRTLVLPWHQYLDVSWVQQPKQRVENFAPALLGRGVISGDNLEAAGTTTRSTNLVSASVAAWVDAALAGRTHHLGALLELAGVRHVLILKDADWSRYAVLREQTDVEIARDDSHLVLLRVKGQVSRAYAADELLLARDDDALIEASDAPGFDRVVYAFDPNGSDGAQLRARLETTASDRSAIALHGRVQLDVGPAQRRFVLVTFDQDQLPGAWSQDGASRGPAGALVINAQPGQHVELAYPRFASLLVWGYLASGAAAVALAAAFTVERRRRTR